ncbi:MAG: hypothetical protein FJW30_24745 [Acidobacteria bacterium]|nr:hypothetical protein [Acidobacteriota bacterium]
MAIDEIFSLLESLQRPGRLPIGRVGTNNANPVKASGSVLRSIAGGLTLAPLVKGLFSLFGGRSEEKELPRLERFTSPAPIRTELGLSQNGDAFVVDRGAGDRIRRVADPVPAAALGSNPAPAAGAQITVNVNAMDSQSFMDRREDIARAVRDAMLHSHSVNDVVSEL